MRTHRIMAIIALAILVSTGCSLDRFRLLKRQDAKSSCQTCESGRELVTHPTRLAKNGWLRNKFAQRNQGLLKCRTCDQSVDVLFDGQCNSCVERSDAAGYSPLIESVQADPTLPFVQNLSVPDSEIPSHDQYNVEAEQQRISEILNEAQQATKNTVDHENEFVQNPAPISQFATDDLAEDSNNGMPIAEPALKNSIEQPFNEGSTERNIRPVKTRPEKQVIEELRNVSVPHQIVFDSSPIIPEQYARSGNSRRDDMIVLQARPAERVSFSSQQQLAQNYLEIAPPPALPVSDLRARQSQLESVNDIPSRNTAYDQIQESLRLPSFTFNPLPLMCEVTESPDGIPLDRISTETKDESTRPIQPPIDRNPPVLLGSTSLTSTDAQSAQILRLRAIPGDGSSNFSNASSSAHIRFLQPTYQMQPTDAPRNDRNDGEQNPPPGNKNARPIFDYDRIHTAIRGTSSPAGEAASRTRIIER